MTSIYKALATPAEPILALSLLQPTNPKTTSAPYAPSSSRLAGASLSASNWNLALDIEKGLYPPSKDNLFHPGKVVGFSRLRGRPNDADDDELVGEVPRRLLTTWLQDQNHSNHETQSTSTQPAKRAYIVHPQTSKIFSPQALLTSLLLHSQHNSPEARNEAIALLDSVTLFPVHDFASATDAIQDVADRLATSTSSPENEQQGEQNKPQTQTQTVVIITALDTLTDAVIRSSNALRGAAVLSGALRTISQLSRVYSQNLSVLLVNTGGVGPSPYQTNQSQQSQAGDNAAGAGSGAGRGSGSEAGIQSMFSTTDTPLFPSLLMKTLDQGIDTHLLVSRVKNERVVEVVKDRVGDGSGRWCVWPGNS
ncbi:hypothetical protein BDV06DRAFT_221616 [Aspergillus oleicola]